MRQRTIKGIEKNEISKLDDVISMLYVARTAIWNSDLNDIEKMDGAMDYITEAIKMLEE